MEFIPPIIFIGFLVAIATAFLMAEGHVKTLRDHDYDTVIEYRGERDKGYSFYSHSYLITVTDKASGDVIKEIHNRYPDIYGNERSWARREARKMYTKYLSRGSSFEL